MKMKVALEVRGGTHKIESTSKYFYWTVLGVHSTASTPQCTYRVLGQQYSKYSEYRALVPTRSSSKYANGSDEEHYFGNERLTPAQHYHRSTALSQKSLPVASVPGPTQ